MSPIRFYLTTALALFMVLLAPCVAQAGPSGSAEFSTSKGGSSSGSGFEWPELVTGGNAIAAQLPLQVGIVGYLPRARFAFQYDRQLRRAHWIQVGAALLFDRASWENFRMDDCGLGTVTGACGKGGVVGFDLYGGYSYKFFVRSRPYIVPIVRGNVGFSWFALPQLGGGDGNRLQSRTKSWTLNVRPGGGVRLFLMQDLAVGADINLPLGFLVHTDVPVGGDKDRSAAFLLGIEILPLIVEYRF
jgi:hypothetical protein